MNYSIKVWLFSIIISPIMLLIFGTLVYSPTLTEILQSGELLFYMILCGFILSIPAMIVFYLIEQKTINTSLSKNIVKVILSVYSFCSVWITFYILDKRSIESGSNLVFWSLVYSLTIVFGVWIFKIEKTAHNSRLE